MGSINNLKVITTGMEAFQYSQKIYLNFCRSAKDTYISDQIRSEENIFLIEKFSQSAQSKIPRDRTDLTSIPQLQVYGFRDIVTYFSYIYIYEKQNTKQKSIQTLGF